MTFWERVRQIAWFFYWNMVRAAYKWFLHVFTGRSEIERLLLISAKVKHRATTVKAIENSLLLSKNEALRNVPTIDSSHEPKEAALTIIKVKAVEERMRSDVQRPLVVVMEQILGYHRLIRSVEHARSIRYDSSNTDHEQKLFQLWSLLMPDVDLEARLCNDWQDIGFQGRDPATDFRGMGVLGLDQLLYLAKCDAKAAQQMLSLSRHPTIGFPFCVAGISMTAMCRELLNKGHLKNHFYNSVMGLPQMADFHRVYCLIFSLFCAAWKMSNPSSVMEFNIVKERFYQSLLAYLNGDNAKIDSSLALSAFYSQ